MTYTKTRVLVEETKSLVEETKNLVMDCKIAENKTLQTLQEMVQALQNLTMQYEKQSQKELELSSGIFIAIVSINFHEKMIQNM